MKKILNHRLANLLQGLAVFVLIISANCRCYFVFHQPKQPLDVKKIRKF